MRCAPCWEIKRMRNRGTLDSAPARKEARRLSRSKSKKEWRRIMRVEILTHYGGGICACKCCGDNHVEFLSLDHIGGGGASHRKAAGGAATGYRFYKQLKKQGYPEGFRTLCMNCNFALGIWGYCPHHNLNPADQKTYLEVNPQYLPPPIPADNLAIS